MSIKTQRYVRKPIYVDAVQVTEENFEELALWCQGDIKRGGTGRFIFVRVTQPKTPRQTRAFVGDWLLYTDTGYKIYTEQSFKSSFDLAESNGRGVGEKKQV